jgi:hypothetical protein
MNCNCLYTPSSWLDKETDLWKAPITLYCTFNTNQFSFNVIYLWLSPLKSNRPFALGPCGRFSKQVSQHLTDRETVALLCGEVCWCRYCSLWVNPIVRIAIILGQETQEWHEKVVSRYDLANFRTFKSVVKSHADTIKMVRAVGQNVNPMFVFPARIQGHWSRWSEGYMYMNWDIVNECPKWSSSGRRLPRAASWQLWSQQQQSSSVKNRR